LENFQRRTLTTEGCGGKFVIGGARLVCATWTPARIKSTTTEQISLIIVAIKTAVVTLKK
jgi:hypothetical protein